MKKQKGITLIALVVTIVVLLILAGIALNLVLGDNGIITRAKQAKLEHEKASANDIETMNAYEDYIIDSSYTGEVLTPTDQQYFKFTTDTATKTATITGIKDGCGYVFDTFYNTAIKTSDGKYITDIVIPSKYIDTDGTEYTVTAIGSYAFIGGGEGYGSGIPEVSFTSFVIPNTITSIGDEAFVNCSRLTSITI